jgi:subtilisin-like proprotein convertase family protein
VQAIPEDPLRVLVTGTNVPANLLSVPATPSLGPRADSPTAVLPLVDLGYATNDIAQDLHGTAALIERGPAGVSLELGAFRRKIERAAAAGAAFAILYNNTNGNERLVMDDTQFVPIPAVMIGQNAGEALRAYLAADTTTRAQIALGTAHYPFGVPDTLSCEHVGVRLQTTHPRRGDVRITVRSPAGTCSVLQQVNGDLSAGPSDWTYYSTQHLFESSVGVWSVDVSDEVLLNTGSVTGVELLLEGIPITDTDQDGLDDDWERRYFGSLALGPRDDPDGDGYNNAQEQAMGTNPAVSDAELRLDLSPWNATLARLSWPGQGARNYEVLAGAGVTGALDLLTNVAGRFPETEWFVPSTNPVSRFFRVQTSAR